MDTVLVVFTVIRLCAVNGEVFRGSEALFCYTEADLPSSIFLRLSFYHSYLLYHPLVWVSSSNKLVKFAREKGS